MKSETKSLSVGGGLAPPERFKHLGDILRWYRFTLIPDLENQISIIGACGYSNGAVGSTMSQGGARAVG